MQKSALLLWAIIVAAATLGVANEALKPRPAQPADIESRIPAPAEGSQLSAPRSNPVGSMGADTAYIFLPPPDTFPIDERADPSPIPDNLA